MLIFALLGMSILLTFFYSINKLTVPLIVASILIGAITGKVIEKLTSLFKNSKGAFSNQEIFNQISQSQNKELQAKKILQFQIQKLNNLQQSINENWNSLRELQRISINANYNIQHLPAQINLKELQHEILSKAMNNIQKDNILLENIVNNPNWKYLQYYSEFKLTILISMIVLLALYTIKNLTKFITLLETKFTNWLYKGQKKKLWMTKIKL